MNQPQQPPDPPSQPSPDAPPGIPDGMEDAEPKGHPTSDRHDTERAPAR